MIAVVASLVAVVLLVLVVVALGMRSMNRRESALPAERRRQMAEQAEKTPHLSSDDFATREPRVDHFSPDFSPIDEPEDKSSARQRARRAAHQAGSRGRRGVDEWGDSDDYDDDYWSRVRADEGGFGGSIAAKRGVSRPVEPEDRPLAEPEPDPDAQTVQARLPLRPPAAARPSALADLVEPARPTPRTDQRTVAYAAPTPEAPARPGSAAEGPRPGAPARPAQGAPAGGTPRRTPPPARRGGPGAPRRAGAAGGRPEQRGGRPDPRTASRPDPAPSSRGASARPDLPASSRPGPRPDGSGTPRTPRTPDPLTGPRPAAARQDPLTAPRGAVRPDPRTASSSRDAFADPPNTDPYSGSQSRSLRPGAPGRTAGASHPAAPLSPDPLDSGALGFPGPAGNVIPIPPAAGLSPVDPLSTGPVSSRSRPTGEFPAAATGDALTPATAQTPPATPASPPTIAPAPTTPAATGAQPSYADILDDPDPSSPSWPPPASSWQQPAESTPGTPVSAASYEVRPGWATIDEADSVPGASSALSAPTGPGRAISPGLYDLASAQPLAPLPSAVPGDALSDDPPYTPSSAEAERPAGAKNTWPTYTELYGSAQAQEAGTDSTKTNARGGHHRAPEPDYPDYYR